jgi:hypothetical protein
MRARLVFLLFLSLFISVCVAQEKPAQNESEVRVALQDFIVAFDNLDWDKFRFSFADDATVFYPRAFA